MASATGDRNLLFGILALQMDFIPRDALVKAMNAWVLDKAKPLGQILVEQQALGSERRALLEALVQEHVKQHDDDPGKSLAAVSSVGSAHDQLQQIADSDVQASLARVPVGRAGVVDPYATEPPSVGAPSVVGRRFRILRPHARGGLGEVFVAQDEELHREVALKEIQERHADHPESRARFLVEAEITGGLEHPGIVPVYGLGQYADGRPFYAMRFIKGDSLKEAIERYHKEDANRRAASERSLELRKLLGRFVDVCDAIEYAHSRGVLHRDLKPGNVMLGKYGETLVVDWGLAKPVGGTASKESEAEQPLHPASADDSAPTQVGTAIGTPAFMPPEQAAGRLDQLGPASDVYSLGATLYCLLTGKAPFEGGDVGALLQRVQRGDFTPPRLVQRDVPAALEAVCLRAMALRPGDRYPTPRALAADIEKWLADEPTTAYREPWGVRVSRWARRNQTLVAAAAAGVLVAILAGGAGALWYQHDQSLRAAEHIKRASNTERDVTAALEEATALGKQAENLQKDDPAKWGEALTVALSAVKRAEGVLNNGEGTDELRARVAAQRETLEVADKDRHMIAALEAARFQEAAAGREGGFDSAGAAALYGAAFQQDDQSWDSREPAEAAVRINQRAIRDYLLAALADWSNITSNKQDFEKLRAVLQAADHDPSSFRNRWNAEVRQKNLDGLRRLAVSPEAQDQPTARLVIFAQTLTELGAAMEAAKFLKEANEKRPGDFWIAFELAFACSETKPPATDEAIRYYTAALMVRPNSAPARYNLGNALYAKHQLDDAIAEYRMSLQIQPDDARAYRKLANALSDKHQWDEAIAEYRKALQIQPGDADTLYYAACAAALAGSGKGEDPAKIDEKERGSWRKQALDWLRTSLNLWTKKIDDGKPEDCIAAARDLQRWQLVPSLDGVRHKDALAKLPADEQDAWRKVWADVDALLKKSEDGVQKAKLDEVIAECRKAVALKPDAAVAHFNLGSALYDTHQWDEAIAEYRKVLQIQPDFLDGHGYLGSALKQKGRLDEAIAEYRKALQIQPDDALGHDMLGNVLYEKRQWDEAIAEYRKALQILPDFAMVHYDLGVALAQKHQWDEAITEYRKALQILPNAIPHTDLAIALKQTGQLDEAVTEFGEALQFHSDDAEILYSAACAAALAGCGQGAHPTKASEKERSRWRRQALDWLQTALNLWTKKIDAGKPDDRAAAAKALQHWQEDSDLARVRDKDGAAKLPADEQDAWRKVWADVEALLKKAGDGAQK